jgi:hypothetical protein
MQEFASLSADTPEALTESLNAKAADGWSLVSIHTHRDSLVAFLNRSGKGAAASTATTAPVNEPAGWASAPTASAPASSNPVAPAAQPVAQPAAAPAAQPAAAQTAARSAAIPANWYPDPSGRYDLRYWDGSQWTEHVSRAGQQFVDPPVA